MIYNSLYTSDAKITNDNEGVKGGMITFENESYYQISNVDQMRPFFMSIVSHSNHWMFISSNGGLSAGRQNSGSSLFPYYTDDKITEAADVTGSKTIFQINKDGNKLVWEPFSFRNANDYSVTRNLYKNIYGNKVVFEEVNNDLGLTFRYHWNSSDKFGFVKKSTIENTSGANIEVSVLDGIQNILPYGLNADLQNAYSNLVDAYKKSELEADSGLGIFALSAIIVDRAEPSESLKATTVWSSGLENPTYLLSSLQLGAFRNGQAVQQEVDVRAEKGAYFVNKTFTLGANESQNWMFVAEVNQSRLNTAEIVNQIKADKNIIDTVNADIEEGTRLLIELNGNADAIQLTADKLRDTRHFSNVLFNIMRGGIFDNNYDVERDDLKKYFKQANAALYPQIEGKLNELPELLKINDLKALAESVDNTDFKRLAFEYLPLKFSRRHGDPSRPWNKFSINTTTKEGNKILDYQGNWRDIFQNWESLAHSYPNFIENMIFKFVNATTFEGYNPYRVTKDGFDWEAIEADDPWSYIGYWGDHQIIYLLKFLEFSEKHFPKQLENYYDKDLFVFANVPYKIKSYADILKNSKDTIDFDYALDEELKEAKKTAGADAYLIKDASNSIYKVNLLEKILVTLLAKISNFIPEGGIWMNTQRPEWNDANNALVGNGVSMVTLYYLRRFLKFFEGNLQGTAHDEYQVSEELFTKFSKIAETFKANKSVLSGKISDADRKTIMDGLGEAASEYREEIYANGYKNEKQVVSKESLIDFVSTTLEFLDHTIAANKRKDSLYHAYNLMAVENENEVSVDYLDEMLEGQVAVLSSGYLDGTATLELLDAMRASALYREDQFTYILYPNKELPRFYQKNNVPTAKIEASELAMKLVAEGNNALVEKDVDGLYHFNGAFNNADAMKVTLNELADNGYADLVAKDTDLLLDLYEEIFDHKSFTGRSGTFFGYEGLGSIYWHMVSKYLLAIQESTLDAIKNNEDATVVNKLIDHYYENLKGIGVHKTPDLYGAIPTDPYSHTPAGKGAQQPGMTGQVKEDILTRFGELGVFVENGKLFFNPALLKDNEYLTEEQTFSYTNVVKEVKQILVPAGALCFTYCQVPVIYKKGDTQGLEVSFNDGSSFTNEVLELDQATSTKLFNRSNEISQITVSLTV